MPRGRFGGGRQSRRDRWYGLEERADFADFRRWWHRVGKGRHGGTDIADAQEARERYDEWVGEGRSRVE